MARDVLSRSRERAGTVTRGGLDETERKLSLAGGAGLLVGSLIRGSVRRWAVAAAGGYLIYRGLTGRCPLSERLGMQRAEQQPADQHHAPQTNELFPMTGDGPEQAKQRRNWAPPEDIDMIDEASQESFPASDAPGFTGASATPSGGCGQRHES